jgi:hypothetical protein
LGVRGPGYRGQRGALGRALVEEKKRNKLVVNSVLSVYEALMMSVVVIDNGELHKFS